MGGGGKTSSPSVIETIDAIKLLNSKQNCVAGNSEHYKAERQAFANRVNLYPFAKVFSTLSVGHRKIAFTLAEVLITLGIIGIVAAMTVPTIIQKNDERVAVTRVKKFYSVINQALLFAISKNGYVDEWTYYQTYGDDFEKSDSNLFVNYIKPYLKISKDCGSNSGCIFPEEYRILNGTIWNQYDRMKKYYKMILADGSYLWIRDNFSGSTIECQASDMGRENVCGVIWLDTNGKRPPNTIGKDTFAFQIQKNRIIPHNVEDCNNSGEGWGCAAYILQHDNMNYLHK